MGVIYEGGEPIKHVYFPGDGLISLPVVMDDATVREIGVVGNEPARGPLSEARRSQKKIMSREEALKTARRLVSEAVDDAARAGVDAASVVAPHCPEAAAPPVDEDGRGPETLMLGEVPAVIDNSTQGLFEMPRPDDDPEQKPAFIVTQSTADLVRQDFERYKPSLERMAEDWEEKKERVLSEAKGEKE